MIDISPPLFTIIMLGALLVGIMSGFPVGFVIGFIALLGGYFVFGNEIINLIYLRAVALMSTYILLAIPLFVFMGSMLEYSGITEKLFNSLYEWFGKLNGGLAVVTILVGTIMAAGIGIIAASVSVLAQIALPSMIKRHYSKSFAAGAVCAGGALGILIPPSIMLVIYGANAQISVGKLFFGAFIPGFVLSSLYCIYILLHSYLQPRLAPAVSPDQRAMVSFARRTVNLVVALAPMAALIMSVLGAIFAGIAPPSEAAGVGAFVATLITIAYGKFNLRVLKGVALATLRSSGFIFLIGAMSYVFVATFMGGGGGKVVEGILLNSPGGRWGFFAVIMFAVFILGFFLDWLPIVFILIPIITPLAAEFGFNAVWFAVIICVNFQMAFMTPPLAMAIYICRGAAAPELGLTMADIIRGVIPFIIIIMSSLTIFVAFPELILWLPNAMIE